MADITIDHTQVASIPFTELSGDGAGHPTAFSAQVGDYSKAYVAIQAGQVFFITRAGMTGANSVTINGHLVSGETLPPLTVTVNVTEPPHFVFGTPIIFGKGITTPADPGSDTVAGSI